MTSENYQYSNTLTNHKSDQQDVGAWIIEEIDRRIITGCMNVGKAYDEVFHLIMERGHGEEAMKALGSQAIGDYWRYAKQGYRTQAMNPSSKPVSNAPVLCTPEVMNSPTVKKLLMDSVYEVDGKWKRLGDMTREDCLAVARDYRKRAKKHTRNKE